MYGMMLIDMHGVTYANNLLKNPATKRLSGNTCKIMQKRHPIPLFLRHNDVPTERKTMADDGIVAHLLGVLESIGN